MKRADASRWTVVPSGRSTARATTTVGVIAALASLVLTGCTADTDAAHRTSPAARVKAATVDEGITDAQELRIADAEQRLIKQCLNRQGFTYWEAERPSLEESRTLGYVADDVAWARKHGYGSRIAAKEDRARLTNPNLVYRKGLSKERRKAYDDALDGGSTRRRSRPSSRTVALSADRWADAWPRPRNGCTGIRWCGSGPTRSPRICSRSTSPR